MGGIINVVRTCGQESQKLQECIKQEESNGGISEQCTCGSDFCNDKTMRETFSSHVEPIDCWHCASSIQPWCSSGSELITHINDPGVRKSCPSARCKTEITGGNQKIILCLLLKTIILDMQVFDFHDLY